MTNPLLPEDMPPNARDISPCRLADALGITIAELATITGVTRNALSAPSTSRATNAALAPLARVLFTATEMAGDESRAAIWFKHQPIPGYGGETAFDLARQGRARAVLDYLASVRAGVYA
jgi:uncharacterized protein (DUF2384 family)